MPSIYRRPAEKGFFGVISDRRTMLSQRQSVNGSSIQDRNPAIIKLTGTCNMCSSKGATMIIPESHETWDDTYKPNFKPRPTLQDVTITYGGDFGLARRITANIKCFDLASFKQVQKHFLMPGNIIDARFWYTLDGSTWNPSSGHGGNVGGFRVATFSFSVEGGVWIGSFTAVSAAEAIKAIDMRGGINPTKNVKYIIAGEIDAAENAFASGIAELISSDAQRNGTMKIEEIKKGTSGYVISKFIDYTPTAGSEVDVGMVVYTDEHLVTKDGFFFGKSSTNKVSHDWSDESDSVHEIYVSLGYVVDRIVNGQVKTFIDTAMMNSGTDGVEYGEMKIKFDPQFSKSTLPYLVSSGNPLSVLILGSTMCKFKEAAGGTYMDFNELPGGDPRTVVDAWDGTTLRLDRILVHKNVVMSALYESTLERPNESETVDPKDSKDTVVSVNDFFQRIFSEIKTCTGGALSLRLVLDPKDEKGFTYLVVDQNYAGTEPIPCYLFDPIDGDGSTRECSISSNGGSNEYRTSMFLANSKKGDIAAKLRDCESELDSVRIEAWDKARDSYNQLIGSDPPGTMMKDKFDAKQIDAYTSVMVDFYRYAPVMDVAKENVNWPGMEIDLTINGSYGIIPGCAIYTTQIPREWLTSHGIYFMVREVTHKFSNNDWSTNIRGIMALYDHLELV